MVQRNPVTHKNLGRILPDCRPPPHRKWLLAGLTLDLTCGGASLADSVSQIPPESLKHCSFPAAQPVSTDEVLVGGSARRFRRSVVRVVQAVLLLGLPHWFQLSTVHAEGRNTAASPFSMDEGGHQGSSALQGNDNAGLGGAGSEGLPLMVGGEAAPQLCDNRAPLDVLFIGNSYTHFYDMPRLLEAMAESAGCVLHAEYVAPGGAKLHQHAASGTTLSAIGARAWDAVVLQNYSQLPSQPLTVVREQTLPSVLTLVNAVLENNPETALYYYVTWGRRDGDKKFCATSPEVCTFQGHADAVYRGYSFYREQTGGDLADVGGAWANIYRDKRKPFAFKELYNPDGTHPSLKGSYLAASVFFATLFKASPEGLAYPQGLSETSAEYIQKVAGRLPISGV